MGGVTMVYACRRDGRGGSPTAVLDDEPMSDAERSGVSIAAGTSHAVFLAPAAPGAVGLRFFTAAGELPACGHGTVAALAVLAARAGGGRIEVALRAGGRALRGWAVPAGDGFAAAFDPGPVDVRAPRAGEAEPLLRALGIGAAAGEAHIASVGRPRLLVPVADRSALAALAPDLGRVRAECDRLGLLGCYVYTRANVDGRAAARMFAPSIGVPEDIANANSTACLAAALGARRLAVDMGDAVGAPATVTATYAAGRAEVGGDAAVLSGRRPAGARR